MNWLTMSKEQRIEAIIPFIQRGLSASQVANQFTNASRNAIIGYCARHKIDLKHRAKTTSNVDAGMTKPKKPKAPTPPKLARPVVKIAPAPAVQVKPTADVIDLGPSSRALAFLPLDGRKPVHLEDIKASQCHWPVNGLEGIEPIFCGAAAGLADTYCGSHKRLAYAPRRQGAF